MNGGSAHQKPSRNEPGAQPASPQPHLASVPMVGDRPSILILFSDTGGGHRASARALEAALLQLNPSVRVVLADPLIGQGRWLARRICSSYSSLAKGSAIVWGAVFHTTNTRPGFAFVRTLVRALVQDVIGRLLEAHDPDVIVSVHPLLNHFNPRPRKQPDRKRGYVTAVADLVRVHRGWSNPHTDLIVVGTTQSTGDVRSHDVPPERIRRFGVPIRPGFRPPVSGEQQALRRQWGLDPNLPTILVMGGWHDNGSILRQAAALAEGPHRRQIIVVCGHNEKLRRDLVSQRPGTFRTPLLILGYVNDIADRMRASDIVVTKAGPGTIAEALATGLPLILTGHVKGQETANLRWVEDVGVGSYVPRASDLPAAVESILGDAQRLGEMKQRALAHALPDSSLDIARECLELARRSRHEHG